MKVTSKPITVKAVQFTGLESIKEMMDCFGRRFKFTFSVDDRWELHIHYNQNVGGHVRFQEWVIMIYEGTDALPPQFEILADAEFKKIYNQ